MATKDASPGGCGNSSSSIVHPSCQYTLSNPAIASRSEAVGSAITGSPQVTALIMPTRLSREWLMRRTALATTALAAAALTGLGLTAASASASPAGAAAAG